MSKNNTPDTNEELNAVKAEQESAASAPAAAKRGINKRNLKHGTMSIVLTLVFVAALVFVNVIVGLLSERFNTSADLSASGMYTIGEDTEEFLKGVGYDITITVLNNENDFEAQGTPYKQVNEILKKMELANPRISIDYLVLDQIRVFLPISSAKRLR